MTTLEPPVEQEIAGPGATDDRSELRREGGRLIALTGLSAVTVPLMVLEMWRPVGGWLAWVVGTLAVLIERFLFLSREVGVRHRVFPG